MINTGRPGGCGPASAITIVNVTAAAPIDPIRGFSSVCQGLTISLDDATPAGSWSIADVAIATVSASGVVTGVAAGVTTVSYIASLGCGLSVATASITVNTAAAAGIITGTSTICTGAQTCSLLMWAGGYGPVLMEPLPCRRLASSPEFTQARIPLLIP